MNRRYKQQKPQKVCIICGDKATGVNFNALTCMSCKAFFRRNALRTKVFQCPFEDNCQINKITRKFCAKCRIRRCFEVGMKKEWILSEEEKAEMKERIARNRETKQAKMLEQLQILKPSGQCFSCTKTPTSTPPTSPPVVTSTSTSPSSPQPSQQQPPPQLQPTALIRQSVIVAPSTSPPPPLQAAASKETSLPMATVGPSPHHQHHHPLLTPSAAAAVFDVLNKAKNTSFTSSSTTEPKTEEDKPKPNLVTAIKAEIPEPTISLKNVLITECEKMLFASKSSGASCSTHTPSAVSNSVAVSLAGGIPISIFHHQQHLRVDNR